MKKLLIYFVLLAGLISASAPILPVDEMDRVIIYLNGKLVGTWRAGQEVVHIDKISNGDTVTFRARTDIGGLGNSSIDIKDDGGQTVDNIQSVNSVEQSADYTYVVNLKKVDTNKVIALQAFLNVDPMRHLPPPTILSISLNKK